MRRLKVAIWQFEPKKADVEANLRSLTDTLATKEVREADLLVAPEMFLTGFTPDAARRAVPERGGVLERVRECAEDAGVGLACSILTRRGTRTYNTFYLWGPDGQLLGKQDKIHLWAEEQKRATPGESVRVIDTPWGKAGGMVCYDVEFPEVARALAVEGAELLLVPSAFYSPTGWDVSTRARALENGCFLVAANQIGGDPNHPHNGMSRIVDPFATVTAEIPPGREGILRAELDPALIKKARDYAPFLRDRRLSFAPRAAAR